MNLLTAIQTLPLKKAMILYESKCKLSYKMADYQINDWLFVWDKPHACICRSRGGSKSKDFVLLLIFRVLRTKEKWAWFAAKGGQLVQASEYFRQNPFVKKITYLTVNNTRKMYFELWDGSLILFAIISTSALGLRLDGIIIDEEEDLEYKQSEEVYPQFPGMFTCSKVGHMIHLGTLWTNTRFASNCENYPTSKTPWDKIPHLVSSPAMNELINDKNVEEWLKDLQYRCILTSPSGMLS